MCCLTACLLPRPGLAHVDGWWLLGQLCSGMVWHPLAESLPAAVQGRHILTQVEHTQKEVSQAEAELAQAKERAQTREKEAAEAQRQAHAFDEL